MYSYKPFKVECKWLMPIANDLNKRSIKYDHYNTAKLTMTSNIQTYEYIYG